MSQNPHQGGQFAQQPAQLPAQQGLQWETPRTQVQQPPLQQQAPSQQPATQQPTLGDPRQPEPQQAAAPQQPAQQPVRIRFGQQTGRQGPQQAVQQPGQQLGRQPAQQVIEQPAQQPTHQSARQPAQQHATHQPAAQQPAKPQHRAAETGQLAQQQQSGGLIAEGAQQPQLQQPAGQEPQQSSTTSHPYVDVFDNPEDFTVLVDLPGCDAEDIQLEGAGNTLRIAATRPQDEMEGESEDRAIQRERPRRSERVIQLPAAVDFEDAEATCENGVCRVRLRKREEEQQRQIGIQ